MSLKAEYLEKAKLRARNTYLRQLRIFTRDTVDDYEFTDRYQLILKYEIESLNPLSYFFSDALALAVKFQFTKFRLLFNAKIINELQSHIQTILTLILAIFNSITKDLSNQAYQTPPTKLFTQSITHYTHTLSRP